MIDRAARVAVPAALVLFVVIGAVSGDQPTAVGVSLVVITVAAVSVVLWRRLEGWPLVGTLAVPAVAVAVACDGSSSNLGWFGACVVVGGVALRASLAAALLSSGVFIALFVAEWTLLSDDSGWGAWMSGTVFTTIACVFARRQRDLVEQLREAQDGLAARARAEERNRVAGEMHDVIGHALTVSLLHVSSARLALDDDPEEARASLEEAERLARESLDEVRAAVGLLRTTDPSAVAPMPSAADVVDLVESFRRAGAQVSLEVHGDLASLGPGRGLAIYRIVQESLTNATRHGNGAPVTVRLEIADREATVTVESGGHARTPAREGTGLVGMRERAEALGGRLVAGPWPGGWRVEAVLPT